jgi:hypothetical protein
LESDSSDDDNESNDEPPPLLSITDDEHNTITRRSNPSPPQHHSGLTGHFIHDIRAATHHSDSDSIHINPAPNDESDEEHLPFWPECAPPTPPLPDPNPPADLNDAQIVQWTRSQMPWHLWRQQQISLGRIPDSQHGPPVIHREMPNRNHMRISNSPSADTLDSTHRMLGYLQSNLPWSTYLDTLPAIARRYYLNSYPTSATSTSK